MDELVRRVVTVINSNDPVARALTLRVLGAIAAIIPERAAVHHKVIVSQENSMKSIVYRSLCSPFLSLSSLVSLQITGAELFGLSGYCRT